MTTPTSTSSSSRSIDDSEDYSPAVTVVPFDPPLPLLRAPVPSAYGEPPVLAFRDSSSWRAAWESAEASLLSQCEFMPVQTTCMLRNIEQNESRFWLMLAGARSGCSITASHKCKPPWWKGLFGAPPTNYEERERCEEQEMAACLAAAKEACIKFAKEKCIAPFRDARIASPGLLENTDFAIWGAGSNKTLSTSSQDGKNRYSFKPDPEATNYKGSDLLDSLSSEENNNSG